MNEEKPVAGLGSPETSTVSVVSPCRPVSPRASPRVNPILLPLGPELGVCDFFTRCALDCHPATTLPVLISLSTIQALQLRDHFDGGGQGDNVYADLRGVRYAASVRLNHYYNYPLHQSRRHGPRAP